jgi:hypothetical protein
MAGYSGKPLSAKLGIKPGQQVALLHAPPDFPATLAPLPARVTVCQRPSAETPVVLLFSRASADLSAEFPAVAAELPAGGMLWVAWPKQAARQATDLREDVVRRIGLAAGLVDVKVCAIDEVWSGLKFVRRRPTAEGGRAPGRPTSR